MKNTVIERKLGREGCMGQVEVDRRNKRMYGKILIDPRQTERQRLDTIIHEKLHLLFPEWSETKVARTAASLATLLWKQNYRRAL